MRSIEEIKKEILLMIMQGKRLFWYYMNNLPKDDSLRTFICELGPKYAYYYALDVDKGPHKDTRKASHRDPRWKRAYQVRFGE